MIKPIVFIFVFFLAGKAAVAQLSADSIAESDVQRRLNYLASDSLKGRGNYSPELHMAARFIKQEFSKAGLKNVLPSFFQPFTTRQLLPNEKVTDAAGIYDPKKILLNVIGMLPGKTLPGEIIIFSAHYDHVGVQMPEQKDSIYNGANDNASGTVALLTLASYFSKKADNQRTLLFCAFAGEELGLFGSRAFVQSFNTNAVKAVINIEMIGRTNAAGKKSVFITGADLSTFAGIFKKNLQKATIRMKKEPGAEKQLFRRSDNYSFAVKGIPAHTIMCSDDSDGCYHKSCDEAERIDIANMVAVIKAIATGSQSIIDGTDTPVAIH